MTGINDALNIKNWNQGGNCYVLKGNEKNKWVGYQESVINALIKKYGDNFNLVIWTNATIKDDYYCIPFQAVEHLFTEQNKTTGNTPNRWTTIIINHVLLMHSNSELSVNVFEYYGKSILPQETIKIDDDYFVENAKAEIAIRLGQSKFRKEVLKNFNYKCCISGITELLTASHIIPWAANKDSRADPANGLCLYVEYDALFDKGYITLSEDLIVVITSRKSELSELLYNKLLCIKDIKIREPERKKINAAYLKYHRENIFKG